jgi:branched-chain amino acid transport system permease protein
MTSLLDPLVTGLINGNAYALIALGLSLIFGVADLVNFAHGSVFAFGAMLGWYFAAVLHWPLPVAMLGVIVCTALLGVVIERVAVRPLARAPRIAPLLSTVAVALILDRASQLIFTPETQLFPNLLPRAAWQLGDIRISVTDLAMLGVTLTSLLLLWFFLAHTRLGRALRATAQDRDAALQMGVNAGGLEALAFAISSALAGIGGVLVGMYYRNVDPSMGFAAGIEGFAAATLGGLGNLPGAVVGGLLLGVIECYGVTWFGGSTRGMIAFGVLVLVLWLRPGGLFGSPNAGFTEPMTGTFFGRGRPVTLKRWQLAAIVAFAFVVLPLVANAYLLRVATIVAIFAILGVSLTLVAGTAGLMSIGQAGFFAIGAYTSALLVKYQAWPFWLALPAAGLLSAICAAVLISPVLKLRGHYAAIVTLGLGAIVTAAILNLPSITNGPLGVTAIPPPSVFSFVIVTPRDYYWLAMALLAIAIVVVSALQRSHLGRAWRAIREDEVAAQASGVTVASYKSLAFAIGAFVAGVAGSLLAHQYMYLNPEIFGVDISVLALTMVVLGGMSNIAGTILGAIVLVGGPELFRPLHDVRILAYGLLLLLLIRYRPQGLWIYR